MSKKQSKKNKPAQSQLPLPGAENGLKKVLHVGCGPKRREALPKIFQSGDWQEIRLDIDPGVQPDIVSDIMEMKPVATGSMDGLYSSHNIEHVFPHQVQTVLGEFHRVLKPGGLVVITCPDVQSVAFHIAQGKLESKLYDSPAGPISPQDILYGHIASLQRGKIYMAHKCAFTAESLGRRMQAAGFRSVLVERDDAHNLWARGFKVAKDDPRAKDDKITLRGQYKFQVIAAQDIVKDRAPDELDLPPKIWKPLGIKRA